MLVLLNSSSETCNLKSVVELFPFYELHYVRREWDFYSADLLPNQSDDFTPREEENLPLQVLPHQRKVISLHTNGVSFTKRKHVLIHFIISSTSDFRLLELDFPVGKLVDCQSLVDVNHRNVLMVFRDATVADGDLVVDELLREGVVYCDQLDVAVVLTN